MACHRIVVTFLLFDGLIIVIVVGDGVLFIEGSIRFIII